MYLQLIFIGIFACHFGHIHSAIPPNFDQLVADLINNVALPRNYNPGVGLTIVKLDEDFTFTKGYGFKDIEKNETVEESTLFHIASVSKGFCATLVAKVLHEKFPQLGEAVLDRPIAKLAPNLNFTFVDRARGEMTSFRDLLSHRTCLTNDDSGLAMAAFQTAQEYAYRTRYNPQLCQYRSGMTYNNAMYALAGELISQINGSSSYDEMLTQFLQDLGMTNSRIVRRDEDYSKIQELATPYYLKDGDLVRSNPNLISRLHVANAAGGVISSAADMTKYIKFHLNLGKVGDKQLVPATVMRWLYKPVNPIEFTGYETSTAGVNGDIGYGLGLMAGFFEGSWKLTHGGYWPPFSSSLNLYPGLKMGIFSAVSGPGETRNVSYFDVHDAIAAIALGTSSVETIKSKLENSAKTSAKSTAVPTICQKCIKIDPVDLPGVYGNPAQGEMEVIFDELDPKGNLRLHYGIWGKAYIRNATSNLYLEWDSDIISDFYSAGDAPPDLTMNFVDKDNFYFTSPMFMYTRNATFDTLPAIPWKPGSCSLE